MEKSNYFGSSKSHLGQTNRVEEIRFYFAACCKPHEPPEDVYFYK